MAGLLSKASVAALVLAGCATSSTTPERTSTRPTAQRKATAAPKPEVATTVPDAGRAELTAMDQSNDPVDLRLTQDIRKALMGDGQLSFGSKNVQIISRDRRVTLRGAAGTPTEREIIVKYAVAVAGASSVDDRLDVSKP